MGFNDRIRRAAWDRKSCAVKAQRTSGIITRLLGRFFRHCIEAQQAEEIRLSCDLTSSDFMTDSEISDVLHGRGHTVNWNEVRRRQQTGEVKAPWAPKKPFGRAVA
jgi:hypothetical protein